MADNTYPVSKTATCKKCGSTNVTWCRGKTGKYYLTEVFNYGTDNERTHKTDFHSNYCGKPDAHYFKQFEISKVDDPPEAEQLDERELEMLALLASYSPEKRKQQLSEMDLQVGLAIIAHGKDDPRVTKLKEICELAEDFCSELED